LAAPVAINFIAWRESHFLRGRKVSLQIIAG